MTPDDPVNPNPCCTLCTNITPDNIFYVNNQCKLDSLTFEQLYLVLRRVPRARADLIKITDDPVLIQIANETRLVTDEKEDDQKAADLINKRGTLPFYMMRGNIDGSIR